VHKYMRTHGSEGATESGQDGPGSVGPSRPAGPLWGSVRPPFSCTRRTFNSKFVEAPPFIGQRVICTERPSTS
jgi:hypothetical protein